MIRIDYTRTFYKDPLYDGGFRLDISVDSAVGVSPAIFVYRRLPTYPGSSSSEDRFEAIASPVDLEEYPEDAPNPADSQWFRRNSVSLLFRSMDVLTDTWAKIQDDIDLLVDTLNAIDTVDSETSYTAQAGSEAAPSSSSSSSSSSS